MNRPFSRNLILGSVLWLCLAGTALAHVDAGTGTGFLDGFLHPLTGLDHVAAMVAVGLWGAFLGSPAIWALPVAFPLMMAVGGAVGAAGIGVAGVETGIAASALVIGFCVAAAARAPLWMATIIVAVFAFFHGYAHGAEMPESADPRAFAIGFVVATGLLHLAGVSFGLLARNPTGLVAVRTAGAGISLLGVGFLTGVL